MAACCATWYAAHPERDADSDNVHAPDTHANTALAALGVVFAAAFVLALLMMSDPSGRRSCDGAPCGATMLEALREGAMQTIRCSGDGSTHKLGSPAGGGMPRLRRSTRPED